MNKDGSGKMTLTVNLSQSKTKVASIMLMDSINGHKVPSKKEIQQSINELSANLKKISGISNVTTTTDFNNYIATLSFSFTNVEAINQGTQEILNMYKVKTGDLPVYSFNKAKAAFGYEYKDGGTRSAYEKLKKEDREVLKDATYTNIYRFPVLIEKSSNKQAKISKSGKAVMQKISILDLINNQVNISNQIQLTP